MVPVCVGRDLAADLAQITFDFPFKIPPYFALIIRAISVLEGIALVGNPGTFESNLTLPLTCCLGQEARYSMKNIVLTVLPPFLQS